MKVTDTAVHKIDGTALHWEEENGKWNKVPTS